MDWPTQGLSSVINRSGIDVLRATNYHASSESYSDDLPTTLRLKLEIDSFPLIVLHGSRNVTVNML